MSLDIKTIFDNDEIAAKKWQSHIVTDIKEAVRDQNRVNIYIDNKFFCSLDISQVVDFHLKIGLKLEEDKLAELKHASEFGKLYTRALEYLMSRPHSKKEIQGYLKRKTLDRKVRVKNKQTGEYKTVDKKGFDKSLIEPVMRRLEERGYIDDTRFARLWVENRNIRKGSSSKKLRTELAQKGVQLNIIDEIMSENLRDEKEELRKIIAKKRAKYDDLKLTQYLLRQGFNYSDISEELSIFDSSSDPA